MPRLIKVEQQDIDASQRSSRYLTPVTIPLSLGSRRTWKLDEGYVIDDRHNAYRLPWLVRKKVEIWRRGGVFVPCAFMLGEDEDEDEPDEDVVSAAEAG